MGNYNITAMNLKLAAGKNLETLYDLIIAHGDELAARWLEGETEKNYTYTRMGAMVDNCAAAMSKAVPGTGWIGIAVDTCPEWPVVFWAILRSGHQALLLDAGANEALLLSIMEEAGCSVLIGKKTRKLPETIQQLDFNSLARSSEVSGYKAAWGRSVAMCTSGTTGKSRIFVYDESTLVASVMQTQQVFEENTRFINNTPLRSVAFLPFHHIFGFTNNVLWGGYIGWSTIYLTDRTPASIQKACKYFKPELLMTVPLLGNNLCRGLNNKLKKESSFKQFMFKCMSGLSLAIQSIAPEAGLNFAEKVLFKTVNEALLGTELKAIVFGGSHVPTETLRTLNALGYYTVCGFGMTELSITGFERSSSLKRRLNASLGVAFTPSEYKVDSNEEGVGELQFRGPIMHSGRLVSGQLLPADVDADGWFSTGDLARKLPDGRIYIQGRLKDVIINESGENIYPDDLEDVFATLPGVAEYSVLGVQRTRKDNNEDVTLVVNVADQYTDNAYLEKLTEQIARANNKLPLAKRVNRVLATGTTLPTANGIKVKRLELKKLLSEQKISFKELDFHNISVQDETEAIGGHAEQQDAVIREDILAKVRSLYAETLDMPESDIKDNAHFIEDLHGDSLQILSMALKAEEEWGVTIPAEEYGRCATVRDMAIEVQHLLNGESEAVVSHERIPVQPITCFEDTPEYKHFRQRQIDLLATGENPYFICHESPLLDTGIVDGKEILEFGSYNYVGMSGRKEVREAAKAAIDKYGTSASGARLLAGEKKVHQQLEEAIADWKHAEAAIVCTGGHSTNVTFVGNFCGKNDLILYDALAHNSIEQGCKLSEATARPFPHNDTAALAGILKAQRAFYEKVLIVIEGAYSMDGDVAPVPEFVKVKKEYGCFLMVDEAHSACVIGENGGGVDDYFHLAPDDIDIKYGTLSKGLGTCGGYLAGKRTLIEYLKYNLPGFVFSCGLSPALAAGSLEALRQLRENPSIVQNLHKAIKCFADSAKRRHLDICLAGETAVLPVMVGKEDDAWLLSNELKNRGVSVPPAMYPAVPKGKARLRFCVISEHKPEQIERALDILEQTAADMGIELPRRNYD